MLNTKDSRRTITFPPFAQTAIASQITGKGGFPWREDGTPFFAYEVQYEFDRIAKEAGIPRVTFHSLRHTQATILAHGSRNPALVSRG